MHIIFGKEQADALNGKYTVLELDTIQVGESATPVTAYCTIENVPLEELPELVKFKLLHENMLLSYRFRDWAICQQAIDQLTGKWGGELDSFYADLQTRLDQYQQQEPPQTWTHIIKR